MKSFRSSVLSLGPPQYVARKADPAPAIATALQLVGSRERGRKDHALLFKDTMHCLHCIHCFLLDGKGPNYHMASASCWKRYFLCCAAKSPAILLGTYY